MVKLAAFSIRVNLVRQSKFNMKFVSGSENLNESTPISVIKQKKKKRRKTAWRIRIDMIKHLAENDDSKVNSDLMALRACESSFNMYQHFAFILRIADRFGLTDWVTFFERQILMYL